MPTETLSAPTIIELQQRYGPMDPSRFRLDRFPATEEDVIELEAHEDRLYELVDGILLEKVMAYSESHIAMYIVTMLNVFVLPRKLGVVTGESGMIRLFPGLVRIPDVAFASWDQFPSRKLNLDDKIPSIHPDLAVEVLSESNTKKEMAAKRKDYFRAGCRVVWFVDPEKRLVEVFTSPTVRVILIEGDTLDGGDVLPGFELPVKDIFGSIGMAE